jgi:uncharacterized protein (TIGR03437 family)
LGKGLGTGAFNANLIIQSPNALQALTVPVMFVLGDSSSGIKISGIANPGSHQSAASPGGLLEIYGTKLSISTSAQRLTSTVVPNIGSVLSIDVLPYIADGVSVTVNGKPAFLTYISPTQVNIQVPYEVGAGHAVIGVNNNGQIAGFATKITPSSPGIFADAAGVLIPTSTVKQGGTTTLVFTGAGEVSPATYSGYAFPLTASASSLPKPVLPVSITVGGQPAFIQFLGLTRQAVGLMQLNFTVPTTVPAGPQPVVVTVNGVSSPPATITVQPAVTTSN